MVRYCPKAIPDHKPSLGMGRMPGGRSEEKSVRAQTRIRLRPSGCVPAGNGRSDYNKYCCNRDCNEPPHPVNSSAAIAAEGRIDEPTDENTADPTKDREPKGSVVSAAWCDELAQQPDDDEGRSEGASSQEGSQQGSQQGSPVTPPSSAAPQATTSGS